MHFSYEVFKSKSIESRRKDKHLKVIGLNLSVFKQQKQTNY